MRINPQRKPPLDSLPSFNEGDVHDDTARNNTPLPGEPLVLEHVDVDHGDVHDGEGNQEARDDGPEEEAVVVDGLEDGQRAGPALVHVEETSVEVLDLPGRNEEEEAQRRERGSSGAEDAVAAGAFVLVAALGKCVVAVPRGSVVNEHKRTEAERSHEASIDELIADQVLGEDTRAKTAGRATQDIRSSFLETESECQRRRGDQVGPKNLQRRKREYGYSASILEAKTDEEKNNLGQVGREKMKKELIMSVTETITSWRAHTFWMLSASLLPS